MFVRFMNVASHVWFVPVNIRTIFGRFQTCPDAGNRGRSHKVYEGENHAAANEP